MIEIDDSSCAEIILSDSRMDGHSHFTVLLCQNAVKCERVTFASLSLTLHFNGSFGRDSGWYVS